MARQMDRAPTGKRQVRPLRSFSKEALARYIEQNLYFRFDGPMTLERIELQIKQERHFARMEHLGAKLRELHGIERYKEYRKTADAWDRENRALDRVQEKLYGPLPDVGKEAKL